ncbi:DUF4861 domain-containing protein [Polaribacter sp. Z014]|uniref:DUF4861 domain-containing protein n=1 Tax=Polaribacter sp. Z014 TaxID=2927126 RepID=UPI0020221B16|nr:DUF4861 domain-containing protein [Polaribacter sp. Z014]MCL7765340.1 DUF4861 domain-containing protein [Polaribacter sp. Z014]
MKKIVFLFLTLAFFISCDKEKDVFSETFEVKNNLNLDRAFETVEIDISKIPLEDFLLVDLKTKERIITQLVDTDLDGQNDILLFQPKIKANSSKKYYLTFAETTKESAPVHCYSRFVPERTDDYAWENNRVAFRTYGPVAQKMIEDGVKGGTLSSGIDGWLKRVDYPIINKWYKKTTEGKGSYHKDTGEGLDNFHVGTSRGVGGIAVKVDTSFYFSKNFTSYKTITTGPIRTSFVLTYANWDANGKEISETKHISLDYGQNLSRFEIELKGTDVVSAGLTLHKKKGITAQHKNWISYWEPLDDSELGQGIVATDAYFINSEKYLTSKKDESNLFMDLRVVNNKVVYYAGFGWKKSNQFKNQQEWESYLNDFSLKIKNPLKIVLK